MLHRTLTYESNNHRRATRASSVIPQKIPGFGAEPHSSYPWNNHPEITTPMEPKHDHSVEIYEKSPDMNLVISYDENLEINI